MESRDIKQRVDLGNNREISAVFGLALETLDSVQVSWLPVCKSTWKPWVLISLDEKTMRIKFWNKPGGKHEWYFPGTRQRGQLRTSAQCLGSSVLDLLGSSYIHCLAQEVFFFFNLWIEVVILGALSFCVLLRGPVIMEGLMIATCQTEPASQ